jgi:hypothetical protein
MPAKVVTLGLVDDLLSGKRLALAQWLAWPGGVRAGRQGAVELAASADTEFGEPAHAPGASCHRLMVTQD